MTEHEPECWCRGCTHPHVCGRCRNCICDELRACEQRVREEIDREAFVLDEGDPFRQVYRKGLDAAREAVAGLHGWSPPPQMLITAALDAIDALKEKP